MSKFESSETGFKISRELVLTIIATLLYLASLNVYPTAVAAQENSVDIVDGRLATEEEAAHMIRIRNTKDLSSCSGTNVSDNVSLSIQHCARTVEADWQLNPGYLKGTPFKDGNTKQFTAARIITLGDPSAHIDDPAMAIVWSETIPNAGIAEIAGVDDVPQELSMLGYGKINETGTQSPMGPHIGQATLAPESSRFCGTAESLLVTDSSSVVVKDGDSGGPLGYHKNGKDGKLKFFLMGTAHMACGPQSLFESVISPTVRTQIESTLTQAGAHTEYQPVPLTSTKLLVGGEAISGDQKTVVIRELTTLSPIEDSIIFNHYQDPSFDTQVTVTATRLELLSDNTCVEVTQEIKSLPLKLETGSNYLGHTRIKAHCENFDPFTEEIVPTVRSFDVVKTVSDGELHTTMKRRESLKITNPLQLDLSTFSTDPQVIYSDKEASTVITATADTANVYLEITNSKRPTYFHYYFTGINRAQSGQDNMEADISWLTDQLQTGEKLTKTLTIPIPVPVENEHYVLRLPTIIREVFQKN